MIFYVIWFSSVLHLTRARYGDISTHDLLYGDLTNIQKLFAIPFNITLDDGPESNSKQNSKTHPLKELIEKLDTETEILDTYDQRYDIQDFNSINIELRNATRKRTYESYFYEYDVDDYYTKNIHERKKKMMLLMANVQFLIHTRVKVAIAVKLRNVVKYDKRYKLGYLFARLRRLLTDQRKVVVSGEGNRASYYHESLYTLMRLYEKVVRLDIDIRDTSSLIRGIYGEKALVDKLY